MVMKKIAISLFFFYLCMITPSTFSSRVSVSAYEGDTHVMESIKKGGDGGGGGGHGGSSHGGGGHSSSGGYHGGGGGYHRRHRNSQESLHVPFMSMVAAMTAVVFFA